MFNPFKSSSGATGISRPFIAPQFVHKQSLAASIASKFYSWTINSQPKPSNTSDKICIICISDTHNTRPSLPDGDILLHAGDLSQYGLFVEIQAQLDWLNAQPHKHKIIVAGNHDFILDEAFVNAHPERELDKPGKRRTDLKWGDIKYLRNSSIEVDCSGRKLSIYGSPMTPRSGTFAFQYSTDEDIWANAVPDGTDIMLVHGPPAGHLDMGKGCRRLLKEVWRARPKLMVFGHIHSGSGEEILTFDRMQACLENALLGVRPWVNVFKLVLHTISQAVGWTSIPGQSSLSTHLVNAAMVAGRGHIYRKEPLTVYV